MSTEIVYGPDDQLWVITGTPGDYHIHPVGEPVAHYDRKFNARKAIRTGQHNNEAGR